ncbi:MAG: TraB/GumN family protein, partial [Gemmobacter sp.]
VTDGPTLPERLPEAEWQALRTALRARGLPVVVAAKSRPWFVASQLSLPPCLTRDAGGGKRGLDHRILALAEARGIPVGSLESHDTLFRLFEALPEDGELGLIRAALLMEGEAEDMSATLTEAYFAERPWAIWEFTKDRAARTPGISPETVAWQIALAEDVMMARRNRAWIPVLTAAAQTGEVLAAFGALHLPGPEGILALLEAEGFTLTRLR